jgi:Sulfatase
VRARRRWGTATVICAVVGLLATQLQFVSGSLPFLRQTSYRRVPVVVVVLDELPVASLMNGLGHVDAATFPSFGRLAQRSTWFRNATTTGVMTRDALPALLTGSAKRSDGKRPHNLFTLLGGAYDINVVERFPEYCPPDACRVRRPGKLGKWTEDFGFFPRGDRGRRFSEFIQMIEPQDEPNFYLLHSVLPHSPWRFLPTGQIYPEAEPEPGEIDVPGPGRKWSKDEWLTAQVYQRHLLQLKLVDRMLGVLIDRLRATGLYDKALMIVTADHGIGFEPGKHKRLVTKETLGAVGGIPMFVKTPGQRVGSVTDAPVEIVDVLPTIADLLDLSTTWSDVQGRSMFAPALTGRKRELDGLRLSAAGLEKYRAVALKENLFTRDESGALDLFSLRPPGAPPIVDQPRPLAASGDLSVAIPDLETYEMADVAGDSFPALLSGSVESAEQALIAIAVNGRIAAVTRTYTAGSRQRFHALLSPRFFGPAPNALDFYLVTPEALALLPEVAA